MDPAKIVHDESDWITDEARLLASIDARLARLEEFISAYEPLLEEAARRMKGPMAWRKER